VIIDIINDQDALAIAEEAVRSLVQCVLEYEGQTCDEVAIHFVSTQKICELHDEFFNDPSSTDCISFPLDDEEESDYRILGEVFVCPATAVEYAQHHSTDPYEETSLYIVHGLLHLMGYDDLE
jgi:probable rRNA maturation factor